MGLEYKNIDDFIYFMNVYLPYQCHNYDNYVEYIEKISAILQNCTTSKLAVIGDFNAAVNTTFETKPSSDHFPVRAKFNLDCDTDSCDGAKNNSNMPVTNFQWTKATDVHIDKYNSSTHINLKTIDIPDAIFCKDVDCKLDHHINDIDAYHSCICNTLVVASKHTSLLVTLGIRRIMSYRDFNEHVKDLHDTARQYYLVWRDACKSRNDETHSDMRRSRLQFKLALRLCRANEDMHRADALALTLKDKNSASFWKDVENMASSKISFATKVGGVIRDEQISDMWHHHFSGLLDSVHNMDSILLLLVMYVTF